MILTTTKAEIKVINGCIKTPLDFGMTGTISYKRAKGETAMAAVYFMNKDSIGVWFYENDKPQTVILEYFDADFVKRNIEYCVSPSTQLNKEILNKISAQPDPYDYYVNHFKPGEPKLAKQDFENLLSLSVH